jgi:predicted TIM-barrel fold metal-dependent hydrolase
LCWFVITDIDTVVGFWPIRNCDIGVTRLQALMARHGIDQACVCSSRGVWYDDEEGNRETWSISTVHPNLIPVATIDPRKFTSAAAEIRRLVDAGSRVFRFFPEYQGWPLNSRSFRRVLNLLDEAGVVIVVGGPICQLLPELKGLRVPVILAGAHFYQLADALACADEMPNVYLSTRLLIGPGSIETAVSYLGHDRLVFGSHAPLVYPASALRVLEYAGLTAEQRNAILHANLWRLIGGG